MQNESSKIFRDNLENLLVKYGTYKELAIILGVSVSTIKSWINGIRTPSLKTLDYIANQFGCLSFQFLIPGELIKKQREMHINNSREIFVRNLSIIFIKHQCFSLAQKLFLLDNQITDYALLSYMRNNNFKVPTLKKLDIIANVLNIPTYELIKETVE